MAHLIRPRIPLNHPIRNRLCEGSLDGDRRAMPDLPRCARCPDEASGTTWLVLRFRAPGVRLQVCRPRVWLSPLAFVLYYLLLSVLSLVLTFPLAIANHN